MNLVITMDETVRLDLLVVKKAGFSREYAREVIENGLVSCGGKVLVKAGMKVDTDADITVDAAPMRYVSRGGYKLEQAINAFGIEVAGKVCVDIGASTGGFTDCLLQHGAIKVTAVDCGNGQLAPSLRVDKRVTTVEDMNIRQIDVDKYRRSFDLAVVDVSFISLTMVLPIIAELVKRGGVAVGLVKPQFEVGKAALNKKGIVTDGRKRVAALETVMQSAAKAGFGSLKHIESTVVGRDGNVEFLFTGVLG
jgi:23S rRNA (cytidine1920-2'-O)/16S rRNA (cytidine1409-2'-O)-methyltransferase